MASEIIGTFILVMAVMAAGGDLFEEGGD